MPRLDADLTRYLSAMDQKLSLLGGTAQQTDDLATALTAEESPHTDLTEKLKR